MLQRATIVATIVMIMCAYVGTANGKAKKIKFFEASAEQIVESEAAFGVEADPDGMAILNYVAGADKTIVQIIVSDMTPLLTYSLLLTDGADGVEVIDAFTTDDEGHGTFHQEFPGVDISTSHVELFVGDAVLWSQPPDQDVIQPTATVRTAVPPLAFTQLIADDFVLGIGETVTKVRWWGGTCGTPDITIFRIQFFDSVGGLPGSVLYTETTASLIPAATGETLDCAFPEAMFEFDIETPFAPGADTYFISIAGVDDDDAAPNFVWTGASSPAGAAFVGTSLDQDEPTINNAIGSQVAFELNPGGTELRGVGCNPEGSSFAPSCP